MCGIVGFIGARAGGAYVLEGLTRLEYRGYDSAGIAAYSNGAIACVKTVGALDALRVQLTHTPCDGQIVIGHTRWSTHGAPTRENAHPQCTPGTKTAIVHNGIIENHRALRAELEAEGVVLTSETDTEVIVHIFERALRASGCVHAAAQYTIGRLTGAYACVIISSYAPDMIITLRRHSPLCIAQGTEGTFIVSDPLACAGYTHTVIYVPDCSYACITAERVAVYSQTGQELEVELQQQRAAWSSVSKQGFEHMMLKEMYEQKRVVSDTIRHLSAEREALWERAGITREHVRTLEHITLFACGTSYHAAMLGKHYIEECVGIPAYVELASEFRYSPFFLRPQSWYIAISQSGETADTLEAVRLVRSHGGRTLALTNVPTSAMVHEADGALCTQAGYEVAVASTKAFTAQVAALYWLAHAIAHERGRKIEKTITQIEEACIAAGALLETSMDHHKQYIADQIAPFIAQHDRCVFLGRGISYPLAREAALKLKELSYVFVDAYPAGELKHGPLAVVDETVPVVIFSTADETLYPKLVSAAQEVSARGAPIVAFALEGQDELVACARYACVFPATSSLLTPLVMVGAAQLLAYDVARLLGRPIDRPRNLAKSISVE